MVKREHLLPTVVAMACGLLLWSGVALTSGNQRISAISFANGLLLGFLLVDESRRWRYSLCAAVVTNVVANLAVGDPLLQAVVLAGCNSLEISIGYFVLRSSIHGPTELFTPKLLFKFIRWVVIAAPLLGCLLAAAMLASTQRYEFLPSFERRFVAHALGITIVTPLIVGLSAARNNRPWTPQSLNEWLPYGVLLLSAVSIFLQTSFPLLFLIFPPLMWVVFNRGYLGAAVGIGIVTTVAVTATIAQSGPLMLVPESTMAARVFLLQLLLASCVVTVYPICAMLARQQSLLLSIANREEQLRIVADNSRDVIINTNAQGKKTFVSPSIHSMLGYTPEEALGSGGSGAIHKEDRELFEREEALLAAGAEGTVASYRVRHRDGHFVWVEVSAKTIRTSAGEVSGWISTTRDVSERKRVEAMKANFISTVSHELRTPVTSIAGALGLILSGKFGAVPLSLTRLLELANNNTRRLALLIDDILDLEKLSAGKMEFVLQAISVDELLENATTANESYAQQYNVKYVLGAACNARIAIDPDRFQQVMANLLSNAAKFSPAGATVDIVAQCTRGDCVVSVIDRGSGIPKEFHPELFTRFSQADPADNRSRAGTGLGMAIAKELTEGMGGTISFRSELGGGTTFYLTFPVATASIAA